MLIGLPAVEKRVDTVAVMHDPRVQTREPDQLHERRTSEVENAREQGKARNFGKKKDSASDQPVPGGNSVQAEQLGWQVPDAIFYPTGGGTGLIGMWKAFAELEAIGFIGKKRPRMVAVQAAGCAPMVKAYEAGEEHAPRWENAHTIASGIRVPQAVGDFLILRAVRESGGFAIAVPDEAISAALDEMAREEGFLLCPEGAATYAAYKQSLADGRVQRTDQVMLFNCASGLKYPLPRIERKLDRHKPIDYPAL